MKNPLREFIEGDYRKLKKINHLAQKVEAFDSTMQKKSNHELRQYTDTLKFKIQKQHQSLNDVLPLAFAVIREAANRVLHMKPYHVQIMGGIILHQGNLAEMKTGEGKTLTATMPVYLNALSGKGVHVITVNEYLSIRDAHEMGKLYNWLGLSVGINSTKKNATQKKKAYQCDIMYSTNSEIGFDYLKDNMAMSANEQVQSKINYALIDEVDSVLIDEAKTPLIIAGGETSPQTICTKADRFAKLLHKNIHFKIDKESKSIHLTNNGIEKAENFFHIPNLYAPDQVALVHRIQQALQANFNMKKDKDYLVSHDEIILIDSFTGRAMDGRRFSDGLHQAIEAKEFVTINKENKTMASITYQNLFRMYKRIAGMTGTGKTEQTEFQKVYNMDVISVPTNRPIQRLDQPDKIYATKNAKYNAIINKVQKLHAKGQPILIGTVAVKSSEELSNRLNQAHITHTVLNAKNNEAEAKIVKNAGQYGAITIATNMASRGTDIKLTDQVKKLGGLAVIGTERHESKRIDNQLRGRAGRQGDPGYSQFFISLEDELIKQYGEPKLKKIYHQNIKQSQAIKNKKIQYLVDLAQIKASSQNYSARKDNLKYDLMLNEQRQVIYKQRSWVLNNQIDLDENLQNMIKNNIQQTLQKNFKKGKYDIKQLKKYAQTCLSNDQPQLKNTPDIAKQLNIIANNSYKQQVKALKSKDNQDYLIQMILLKAVNKYWAQNLDKLTELQTAVQLRSYAQKDATMEYQKDAFKLFNEMINNIEANCVQKFLCAHIETE